MAAAKRVKAEGLDNDLLARIANDEKFGMSIEQLESIMKPSNFVGMAPQQVDLFLNTVVRPILENNDVDEEMPEIKV